MTILPIKRVQEKRRERKKHKEEEQDWIRKEKEDQRPQWLEKRDKSKCHHCGQLGHNKCECRNRAPPRRLQQQLVYNFHGPGKLFINKNKPYFADDIVSFLFHEKWPGYNEFTCQVNATPSMCDSTVMTSLLYLHTVSIMLVLKRSFVHLSYNIF